MDQIRISSKDKDECFFWLGIETPFHLYLKHIYQNLNLTKLALNQKSEELKQNAYSPQIGYDDEL